MKKLPISMEIYLYDAISQQKNLFQPIDDTVKMYVCGPTVYKDIHVGNARPTIVFDVLFRLLRYLYGYENVKYIRNITDVDDKIIAESEKLNISAKTLTENITKSFHNDMSKLNNLTPTIEPRATDHIEDMISIIVQLIKRGFAYEANDHVFFDVSKFSEYGEISKIKQSEIIAGARVEIAEIKRNSSDFVLWKPSENQPNWPSPWGNGRPGWHIECSAMSYKYLGKTFDIHGGGHDLMFPHHDNTNAQSRCCHGVKNLAKFWLHNGMINIKTTEDVEKMSKSLGNTILLKDALNNYSGEVIRYFFLSSHYRKDMIWSEEGLSQAQNNLKKLLNICYDIKVDNNDMMDHIVLQSLMDDLNTPMALTRLHEIASNISNAETLEEKNLAKTILAQSMQFLGIFSTNIHDSKQAKYKDEDFMQKIKDKIAERQIAKSHSDYKKADDIRKELQNMGIEIRDTKNGVEFDFL